MNASIGAGKGATDTDILRAHYSFADADDAAGLAGLNQLCSQVEPDIVVVTGSGALRAAPRLLAIARTV